MNLELTPTCPKCGSDYLSFQYLGPSDAPYQQKYLEEWCNESKDGARCGWHKEADRPAEEPTAVTPLHELDPVDLKIVSGILDMYEAAWADGVPDIDHYVSGIQTDVLPTLLYCLAELEATAVYARGLFPQEVMCATTPELKAAVAEARRDAEILYDLLPTLKEVGM